MTESEHSNSPDFFEDHAFDPFETATRARSRPESVPKKKAGFYLSRPLLERFNRQFHRLKLAGAPIDNKSALLEMALCYALDDLEKGERSELLRTLK